MTPDRLRAEVPPVVTALVGIVVAVVSGVFGMSAHGLATTVDMGPVTSAQILQVAAASAGVGAVAAALARRRSPVATATLGLLAGQGLVHLILSTGHDHALHAGATAGAAGQSLLAHHVTDPAAVRAAMDAGSGAAAGPGAGAGAGPLAHAAALLTPGMLAAHVAAVLAALTLVAILSGTLAWVAAQTPRPVAGAHPAVVVVDLLTPHRADTPWPQYLLSGAGTRAPPLAV